MRAPALIDLDALKRVAAGPDDREVVSRRWLARVAEELAAGRAAQARLGTLSGQSAGVPS